MLAAASRNDAVVAVAAYEPAVCEVLPPEDADDIEAVVHEIGELVADGRLTDAARTLVGLVTSDDDELAAVVDSDYIDAAECIRPHAVPDGGSPQLLRTRSSGTYARSCS